MWWRFTTADFPAAGLVHGDLHIPHLLLFSPLSAFNTYSIPNFHFRCKNCSPKMRTGGGKMPLDNIEYRCYSEAINIEYQY